MKLLTIILICLGVAIVAGVGLFFLMFASFR